MITGSIKIEKIRLQEIYKFACNALHQPPYQAAAPISLRRALSQSNNPYGRPDDVALLVALNGDQCVGYQGILPGLFCQNGKLRKVHWSTAFFVSADYRGKGVASHLLKEIKKLNIDFPVTRMTESARQAYLKAGFKELGRLTYYQLRMEKIRKLGPIYHEAEASFNKDKNGSKIRPATPDARETAVYERSKEIFYEQIMAEFVPSQDAFVYKQVDQIDVQAQNAIQLQSRPPRFYRGIEAINWMLKYRWIISAEKEKTEAEPYYFSLVSDLFEYVALEFYSAGKKVFKGFMVLSVSSKKGRIWIKILDFAFKEAADCSLAACLALKYAKRFSADRLEFPADLLGYFEKNPLLQPLIKKQQRLYVYYPKTPESALEQCAGGIELDYCDADTAFT